MIRKMTSLRATLPLFTIRVCEVFQCSEKANGGADPLTTVSLNEEEALIRWLYRYVEVVAVAERTFRRKWSPLT